MNSDRIQSPVSIVADLDANRFLEFKAHELALKYAELRAEGKAVTQEQFFNNYKSAYSSFESHLRYDDEAYH